MNKKQNGLVPRQRPGLPRSPPFWCVMHCYTRWETGRRKTAPLESRRMNRVCDQWQFIILVNNICLQQWSSTGGNSARRRTHSAMSMNLWALYTWTSPDGQHQNQIDYIFCSQRWRSSIQSAKTRLGADYSSDHELLIANFRLKLKNVGKTTRPFTYDLNLIIYSGSDK